VGEHGHAVQLDPATRPLTLTAIGRGRRQVVKTDRYGFPRTTAGRIKRVQGLQTGDWVKLVQPHGKYAGKWIGTLKGVRRTGQCDLQTARGRVTAPAARFTILQRTTGYAYAL